MRPKAASAGEVECHDAIVRRTTGRSRSPKRPNMQEEKKVHRAPTQRGLRLLVGLTLTMLAAWGGGTTAGAQRAPTLTLSGSGDALDPRHPPFNALPNDGKDDREQLQHWIDAGCASAHKVLYLPPGDWHVTRRSLPGGTNIGSLRIVCDGLTLLGAGRASRIVMKGTAISPTHFRGPADWWVFDLRGQGITIEGIAIDGSQRADTGEQTHLIQIVGPARDIELRRLYLHLPVLAVPEGAVPCKVPETDPEFTTRMCVVPDTGVYCVRTSATVRTVR
jgi:hypothetical protein